MKAWANALGRNTLALYLAARDPRVPLLPKLVIAGVVAYAFSPIDLIPDFIPLLGYLDDLLLLPLGIWLALRLVPSQVWRECQAQAALRPPELRRNGCGALMVVAIWVISITAVGLWLWRIG